MYVETTSINCERQISTVPSLNVCYHEAECCFNFYTACIKIMFSLQKCHFHSSKQGLTFQLWHLSNNIEDWIIGKRWYGDASYDIFTISVTPGIGGWHTFWVKLTVWSPSDREQPLKVTSPTSSNAYLLRSENLTDEQYIDCNPFFCYHIAIYRCKICTDSCVAKVYY